MPKPVRAKKVLLRITSQADACACRQALWRTPWLVNATESVGEDVNAVADAVITDQVNVAMAAFDRRQRVLLLHPFAHADLASRLDRSQRALCCPARWDRYQGAVEKVHGALRDGRLGKPGLLRIHHWLSKASIAASPKNAPLRRMLDLTLWLFGDEMATVQTVAVEPVTQIHLGFANGAMAQISLAQSQTAPADYFALTAIGSSGAAYIDERDDANLNYTQSEVLRLASPTSHAAWTRMIDAFGKACQAGHTDPTDPAEPTDGPFDSCWDAMESVSALARRVDNNCQRIASDNDSTGHGLPPLASTRVAELENRRPLRALVLSVVKHDYIARAVAGHAGFDLVGVADDIDRPSWTHDRNAQFADEFALPYIRNPERAFAELQPEVAIISSEAERHCDLAVRAANAGVHLIVDKPLSTKLEDCVRLVDAVERAGVRSLIWNRSLLPALLQAKQAIEEQRVGSLRSIHCDFYFAKDAGPPLGSRAVGDPPIDWLQRQLEAHADGSDGGVGSEPMGELQVEGIYPLAYIQMLAGRRVMRVFARTTSHFHQAHADNEVDDLATVTLELEGGLIGSLCMGRIGAASHPELGEIKLHVVGEIGAIIINEASPEVALHYRGQSPLEHRRQRVDDENPWLLLENFLNAVHFNEDTLLDVQSGRDICAVIEACLRSSQSHQPECVLHTGSRREK